jgi:hypothetical protein
MRLRIIGQGEWDHHGDLLRFNATIDGKQVPFSIDSGALWVIRMSMSIDSTDQLQIYQVSGRLLARMVEAVYREGGCDPSRPYYIGYNEAMRVTGVAEEPGAPTPKKWLG